MRKWETQLLPLVPGSKTISGSGGQSRGGGLELLIYCLSSNLFPRKDSLLLPWPLSAVSTTAVPSRLSVRVSCPFLPHTPCSFTWWTPTQGDSVAFSWAQIPVWLDFHFILAQHNHASSC